MNVPLNERRAAALRTSPGEGGAGTGTVAGGGRYLDAVSGFADRVIRDFRDTFGPEPTPLFVDAADPVTLEPLQYPHAFGDQPGGVLCNLAYQQAWLRTLVALTAATGQARYEQEAEACVRCFLPLAHPESGLLPWGGHFYYNLTTRAVVGYVHELKAVFPCYDLMWRIDSKVTRRYIEAFFEAHVEDWTSMVFNRHGHFDGSLLPQPLTFLNTGIDLILAGVFHFLRTGESRYLDGAWRLTRRFDEARDPGTGLGPYMFTERPDQMARRLFGPGYSELNIVPYGYRFTYFDFILLHVSKMLGDEPRARDFLDCAVRDLKAYARYGYDRTEGAFYAMLCTRTGQRLTPADFKDPEARYFQAPELYVPRGPDSLGHLLRSYVLAYQLSHDEELLETARLIVRLMDLDRDEPLAELAGNGDSAASAIQGLIDLFAVRGVEEDLSLARRVADEALARLGRADLLMRAETDSVCWINQRLPLALIRLHCVEVGVAAPIPIDPGGTIRSTLLK